jgi:hypothetical protein
MRNFAICINPTISDKSSIYNLLERLSKGSQIELLALTQILTCLPGS